MHRENAVQVLKHYAPADVAALSNRLHSFAMIFRHAIRAFSSTRAMSLRIVPVPVRSDNYAYLLIDEATNTAAAVDPYDVPKVQAAADNLAVRLTSVLTTHHHHDHSGGNAVRYLCSLAVAPL